VPTQVDGRFVYTWEHPSVGLIAVQASWIGNRQYNGATSAQTNIIILPIFLVALILCLVLAVVIISLVFFRTSRKNLNFKNQV
jgi:heme/copper-type cytochrome/quinol oxidase subunit 2